ncbi:MAG: alkaline phosphatase D family protein [Candidatus Sericytochromatia bacterium]
MKYLLVLAILILFPLKSFANENVFPLGVASGDPLTDSVIIWTKINESKSDVKIKYEVSEDIDFNKIVSIGESVTNSDKDYTVKVDVKGLKADKTYYYRFIYNQEFSEIGRTKTLPLNTRKFKIAFTSCQHFSDGYFSGYEHIMKDNPDLIVMLGDFIYEYARDKSGQVREDNSGYAKDLESFRKKYKIYLTDKSLRKARQNFPFISIWDDHEVMNDYSGVDLMKKDPNKLLSGYKAYFEYIPIREIDKYRIYKNFKIGNLLELFMLDGRQYRDENVCHDIFKIDGNCTRHAHDKERTYLGKEQKEWLIYNLEKSTSIWKVLGNNTAMLEISLWGNLFNFDQWDGFYTEKEEFIHFIDDKVKNLLLITGDIHTFIEADIKHNSKVIAKEVTATSLATRTHNVLKIATAIVPFFLSHVKYVETNYRGYILTEFSTRKTDIYLYALDSVKTPESNRFLLRHIELISKKN